ncbi:MAG: hypothetical protein KKA07_00345 [Bacteroidetes bacterium]|nr:hypothetical protein [Bacteroidota bacterium]MBU1717500.1 hypothetical protein [Bacteroidota bacterium]
MKQIIALLFVVVLCSATKAQVAPSLNSVSAGYFTKTQIDTMSDSFIRVQNYMAQNSYEIFRRWDKSLDSAVVFSRDTVDIRPFLTARKDNYRTWLYDVYPDLVVVLHSKAEVIAAIRDIYKSGGKP